MADYRGGDNRERGTGTGDELNQIAGAFQGLIDYDFELGLTRVVPDFAHLALFFSKRDALGGEQLPAFDSPLKISGIPITIQRPVSGELTPKLVNGTYEATQDMNR